MDIFISHSSQDRELIEEIIQLLEKALGIDPQAIRATSVPGYKLDPGVDTDERIRKELNEYKVVIGVLTPESLKSSYVLFELGARWGQKLFIAPLFAKGVSGQHLKGPISGTNGLSAENDSDLHHFLKAIATQLGLDLRAPALYTKQLKKVSQLAASEVMPPVTVTHEKNEMVYEAPYYWKLRADTSKDGPYCQVCFDTKNLQVRLQAGSRAGIWPCQNCKTTVTDGRYVRRSPTRAITDDYSTFR
jgi:ribosomal protein L37AE/L43A